MDQTTGRMETSSNNWQQEAEAMNLNLTVPSRFTDAAQFHPNAKFDSKTGLAVQDEVIRQELIRDLTGNIREGKKWACLHGDLDQLKLANKRGGRQFGDLFIKWGGSQVAQAVERLNLSSETKIVITRAAHAADETTVWFFNVTDEDLKKLKGIQEQLATVVPFETTSHKFALSTALITNNDPIVQDYQNQTKKFLEENPDRQAANFFQFVENGVNVEADMMKLSKDLTQIPLEELLKKDSLSKFIKLLTQNYGGGRIHEEILQIILRLQSVETVRILKDKVSEGTYRMLLEDLGVNEERLSKITTVEGLVSVFQDLFGKEE